MHTLWPHHTRNIFDSLMEAIDCDWASSAMSAAGSDYPPMEVTATDDGATIAVHMPGMNDEDIELSLDHDTLTIKGKRLLAPPEGAKVLRRERRDRDFTRSVRLSFVVDPDKGDAVYRNGVLTVTVHRHESTKPRRIAVESK